LTRRLLPLIERRKHGRCNGKECRENKYFFHREEGLLISDWFGTHGDYDSFKLGFFGVETSESQTLQAVRKPLASNIRAKLIEPLVLATPCYGLSLESLQVGFFNRFSVRILLQRFCNCLRVGLESSFRI
jgi:hypothetical protein